MDLGKENRLQDIEQLVKNYPHRRYGNIYITINHKGNKDTQFAIKHRVFLYEVEWTFITYADLDQAKHLLDKGLASPWNDKVRELLIWIPTEDKLRAALQAIADGYDYEIFDSCYVRVKNPDFDNPWDDPFISFKVKLD